jgi:hypothetical protein
MRTAVVAGPMDIEWAACALSKMLSRDADLAGTRPGLSDAEAGLVSYA